MKATSLKQELALGIVTNEWRTKRMTNRWFARGVEEVMNDPILWWKAYCKSFPLSTIELNKQQGASVMHAVVTKSTWSAYWTCKRALSVTHSLHCSLILGHRVTGLGRLISMKRMILVLEKLYSDAAISWAYCILCLVFSSMDEGIARHDLSNWIKTFGINDTAT